LEEVGQDDQPISMKDVKELGAITWEEEKMESAKQLSRDSQMKERARHDLIIKSNTLLDEVCLLTLEMWLSLYRRY
jgi:hypothetical protein